MPGLRERELIAEIARKSAAPRWVACVITSRQARLAMDIVMMMAPARPTRRIKAFDTTHAGVAWLLTPRPEAQARLLSLVREVERLAETNRVTARDLRHLRTPAP